MSVKKQFVITKHMRTWLPTEYYVRDSDTQEIIFYAVTTGFWKTCLDVYESREGLRRISWSIKSRNVLALAFDITDVEDNKIGSVILEDWFSPSWQIMDARTGAVARLTRTSLFPYKDYLLCLEGEEVCSFNTKHSLLNLKLYLNFLDSSPFNIDLILTGGLLIQALGNGGGGDGAG